MMMHVGTRLESSQTGRESEKVYTVLSPSSKDISIDWDNNPRFPGPAQGCVTGVTPEKFEHFLRKAKDYVDAHPDQTPLVTINAWNEWSEGSCLEPDTYYKCGFLKAVRKVFGK